MKYPTPEELSTNESCCEEFRLALADGKFVAQIPLLNYTPPEEWHEMSIVRFRGIVQDMLDPEMFLERYEVRSACSTRMQAGKYRDCYELNAGEEVVYDSGDNVYGERRTLFIVSIPGLNSWAEAYENEANCSATSKQQPIEQSDGNLTVSHTQKRAIEENDCTEMEVEVTHIANKRQCVERCTNTSSNNNNNTQLVASRGRTLGTEFLLNSPIPDRPSKACMVKVYSDFDSYTLNSVVDVVGFLSINPALDGSLDINDCCKDFESVAEIQAHNPPPSLIPRLHAIVVQQLPHCNPLLDTRFSCAVATTDNLNMPAIRDDLRTLFSLCLFNDELAADYLLSHLISTVYSRSEMQSIGKFTLNICNLPSACVADYTKNLYSVLELLLPVSHYLPLTLDNMNTMAFIPKKDYETNRLVSGLLQLAPHTHLVLDETRMQQGKLEAAGVLGIQSIAHLITQQQIKCNFQYYDIEYNADVPVLVLSEGRSMLPNDFTLPLQMDAKSIELIGETFKAAHHFLQQRLQQFRLYLTQARMRIADVQVSDSKMIEADFVEMRKTNAETNADDLHALLVLSRLLAVARGRDTLDKESWHLAKQMENERQQRIQCLPKSRLAVPGL